MLNNEVLKNTRHLLLLFSEIKKEHPQPRTGRSTGADSNRHGKRILFLNYLPSLSSQSFTTYANTSIEYIIKMPCQPFTYTCSSCSSNQTNLLNTVPLSEADAMPINITANMYLGNRTDGAPSMTREKLLSIISTVMDILDEDDAIVSFGGNESSTTALSNAQ